MKRKPVSLAVAAAAGLMGAVALPSAAQEDPSLVEEVIVTGSRIVSSNLVAPTPITTINSEAIEFTGQFNSADILRTIPSVGVSGFSSTNSNFAVTGGGLNTVDLRNLDENRTLVLVNGRRYVSGVAGENQVDFNTIPTELIERIEVITGGASAIYGSDALAGVVNVILKDDFQGFRVTAQAGETWEEGDGQTERLNILMGDRFDNDRGGAVLSITYSEDGGIRSRDRDETAVDDLANCYLTGNTADCVVPAEPFFSSFPPQGRFNIISTGEQFTLLDGTTGPNGTVDNFVGSRDGFNRQAFRRYSVPLERVLVSGLFDYRINDRIEAYSEVMFARTETATEIEPFPLEANDLSIPGIPVDNPFMPQAIRDAALAAGDQFVDFTRRTVELAQRGASAERQTLRLLFGMRGDINDDWSWDAFISRGYMEDNQLSTGQVNVSNFREALRVEQGPDGQLRCASESARIEGCAPVNVFGAGAISRDAADYLSAPALRGQETEQTNVALNLTGTVMELPAGPLAVAVGYEYRDEFAADTPDALVQLGQNGGNASQPTEGEFDVNDLFLEVDVPLLADKPLIDNLSLGAAYRYSDYSTIGTTDAYTARISWSPTRDLRFRAQYARAVRAPTINELFSPGGENFATVSDPCNGVTATTTGVVAENCRAIPAVAQRIAETGSFTLTQPEIQGTGGFTSRGNLNLSEETADSYTFGVVYTADFDDIGSLDLTLDWYDIKIDDFIDTVGRQTSLDFCYNSPNFPNAFCDFVERDATGPVFQQGELTAVNSGFINEGELETSGLDVQANWNMALSDYSDALSGNLTLRAVYTYLNDYTLTQFGEPDDLTGEQGYAEHEALLTAIYSTDRLVLQWETLYIHESTVDKSDDFFNFEVGDYVVHDVFAAYNLTDSVRISAGIDNLLEEDSPPILSGVPGNTIGWDTNGGIYPQGAIGRSYYVIFDLQF